MYNLSLATTPPRSLSHFAMHGHVVHQSCACARINESGKIERGVRGGVFGPTLLLQVDFSKNHVLWGHMDPNSLQALASLLKPPKEAEEDKEVKL